METQQLIALSKTCEELLTKTLPAFGPKGMNKRFLNELEFGGQPVAYRDLVLAGKNQRKRFNDGANLLISIAVKHLQGAKELIMGGMNTNEVIEGYRKATTKLSQILEGLIKQGSDTMDITNKEDVILRMKARIYDEKNQKVLCPLIADACIGVYKDNPSNINFDNVRVDKLLGKSLRDSITLRGMVLKANTVVGSIQRAGKTKVVVITDTSFLTQPENDPKTKEVIEAVARDAEVIVSGAVVGERALHFCEHYKIMVLKIDSQSELERFRTTTNAVEYLIEDIPCHLGEVDSIQLEETLDPRLIITNKNGGVSTILLGVKTYVSPEMRRAVYKGVSAFEVLCKDSRIVPGAGATEIEIARKLKEYSCTQNKRSDKLAIAKYAESFEVIPRQLAISARLLVEVIMSGLDSEHKSGNVEAGIDLKGGGDDDSKDAKIWDLYATKNHGIKVAADAVCEILEDKEGKNQSEFTCSTVSRIPKERFLRNYEIALEMKEIMRDNEVFQNNLWLAILKNRDTIFALSQDGRLYAIRPSTKLCWCTNVCELVYLTDERVISYEKESPLLCSYMFTETEGIECHGERIFRNNYRIGHDRVELTMADSNLYFHMQTGDEIVTANVNESVLCLKRRDYDYTWYRGGRKMYYRRSTSFQLYTSKWRGNDNDMLLKLPFPVKWRPSPGEHYRNIPWNGIIGDRYGNELVKAEANYNGLSYLCLEQQGCETVGVLKLTKRLSDVSRTHMNLLTLFGVFPYKGTYLVFTDTWGTPLSKFPDTTFRNAWRDNTKSLKLIRGLLGGIQSLHENELYIGTLGLDNVYVNQDFLVKVSSITVRTKFPVKGQKSSMGVKDDMYKVGEIAFYCLTGIIYSVGQYNLYRKQLKHPVDKITADALDLLRMFLYSGVNVYTATEALKHNIFLLPKKHTNFIRDVMQHCPRDKIRMAIGNVLLNRNWSSFFPVNFCTIMEKGNYMYVHLQQQGAKDSHRKQQQLHTYNYSDILDLFKMIRNLLGHFGEIKSLAMKTYPDDIDLAEMFDGDFDIWLYNRFQSVFPTLINESWKSLRTLLKKKSEFGCYY